MNRPKDPWPRVLSLPGAQGGLLETPPRWHATIFIDHVALATQGNMCVCLSACWVRVTGTRLRYLCVSVNRGLCGYVFSGQWRWVDGSDMPVPSLWFNKNDRQEPNNGGRGENCAEVLIQKRRWNDVRCTKTSRFK